MSATPHQIQQEIRIVSHLLDNLLANLENKIVEGDRNSLYQATAEAIQNAPAFDDIYNSTEIAEIEASRAAILQAIADIDTSIAPEYLPAGGGHLLTHSYALADDEPEQETINAVAMNIILILEETGGQSRFPAMLNQMWASRILANSVAESNTNWDILRFLADNEDWFKSAKIQGEYRPVSVMGAAHVINAPFAINKAEAALEAHNHAVVNQHDNYARYLRVAADVLETTPALSSDAYQGWGVAEEKQHAEVYQFPTPSFGG